MWTDAQEHAAKRLQYHFHTWRRQPHDACKAGVCHMQYDDRVSDEISVCSLDSLNVHLCTPAACKFREEDYSKNDIVCTLTGRVVGRCRCLADFEPTSTRNSRFNLNRHVQRIREVINMICATLSTKDVFGRVLANEGIITQVVCMLWREMYDTIGTPRKLLFFTCTCMFMLRSGIQPHFILPRVAELRDLDKPTVTRKLRACPGIVFSAKTMSDNNTKVLAQIR